MLAGAILHAMLFTAKVLAAWLLAGCVIAAVAIVSFVRFDRRHGDFP